MTFGLTAVSVSFGDTEALRTVTMDAPSGAITMVVGGDGAGKTTLLRTLVGLIEPGSGRIRRPPPQRVGYLPTGAGSWRNLTVDENVAFVGGSFGLRGEALHRRADPLLERAGLGDARDRLASHLSGGMRNKLGFCLAMLGEPELLALDEPTTGVDPASRIDLWRLVSESAADGAAVVMSTTYLDEAERAGSVYLLDAGTVLLAGPPEELIASFEGEVVTTDTPTNPDLAWRSGRSFREWWPQGSPDGGIVVDPDLEDLTIVAELAARERPGGRR